MVTEREHAGERARDEARTLARRVAQVLHDQILFRDPETGESRPPVMLDVAVLLRSRTHQAAYVAGRWARVRSAPQCAGLPRLPHPGPVSGHSAGGGGAHGRLILELFQARRGFHRTVFQRCAATLRMTASPVQLVGFRPAPPVQLVGLGRYHPSSLWDSRSHPTRPVCGVRILGAKSRPAPPVQFVEFRPSGLWDSQAYPHPVCGVRPARHPSSWWGFTRPVGGVALKNRLQHDIQEIYLKMFLLMFYFFFSLNKDQHHEKWVLPFCQ